MKVNVVKNVLQANDVIAEKNRKLFKRSGVVALNVISSPGSGKTTLLEKTMAALSPQKSIAIVGDLQTTRDAERLAQAAVQSVQINTGMSCHLYANQVAEALEGLCLRESDYVFIENVGNMICPGEFDLGENRKVVLLSIPEGDDKVAKYPTIFRAADVVLLTKADLRGILAFNVARVQDDLRKLNDKAPLLHVSALHGDGMKQWCSWLHTQRTRAVGARARAITA